MSRHEDIHYRCDWCQALGKPAGKDRLPLGWEVLDGAGVCNDLCGDCNLLARRAVEAVQTARVNSGPIPVSEQMRWCRFCSQFPCPDHRDATRAARYLEKCEPAVSGQGGHNTMGDIRYLKPPEDPLLSLPECKMEPCDRCGRTELQAWRAPLLGCQVCSPENEEAMMHASEGWSRASTFEETLIRLLRVARPAAKYGASPAIIAALKAELDLIDDNERRVPLFRIAE